MNNLTYPLVTKADRSELLVVEFEEDGTGTVIFSNISYYPPGYKDGTWKSINSGHWKILNPLELNALETTHGIPIIRKV